MLQYVHEHGNEPLAVMSARQKGEDVTELLETLANVPEKKEAAAEAPAEIDFDIDGGAEPAEIDWGISLDATAEAGEGGAEIDWDISVEGTGGEEPASINWDICVDDVGVEIGLEVDGQVEVTAKERETILEGSDSRKEFKNDLLEVRS